MSSAITKFFLFSLGLLSPFFAKEGDVNAALIFAASMGLVCLLNPLMHILTTRKYFAVDNPHVVDLLPRLKKLQRSAGAFMGLIGICLFVFIVISFFLYLMDKTGDKITGDPRFWGTASILAIVIAGYTKYSLVLKRQIAQLTKQQNKQSEKIAQDETIKAIEQYNFDDINKIRFGYLGKLALVIGLIWVGVSLLRGEPTPITSFWFLFLAAIAYLITTSRLTQRYRQDVKNRFLPRLLDSYGLQCHSAPVFDMHTLVDHKVIHPFTSQKFGDIFSGDINARRVEIQEFDLLSNTPDNLNSQKKRTAAELLSGKFGLLIPRQRGIAIRIPLNKKLDCHTLVFNKKLFNAIRNDLADYKNVGLLKSKLTKFYDIYANDQVEARYIFDPLFMERFAELIHSLPITDTKASFKGQELIIVCLQDKDHFETGSLFRPFKRESFEPVIRELETVKNIIELLGMDPERGL